MAPAAEAQVLDLLQTTPRNPSSQQLHSQKQGNPNHDKQAEKSLPSSAGSLTYIHSLPTTLEATLKSNPRFGKAFGYLHSVNGIAAEIASNTCVGEVISGNQANEFAQSEGVIESPLFV